MGFYIRKSFGAGPFRMNLSKGGLGFSAGVKGLRVGTGSRGRYLHAGRNGLYYRKSFGKNRRSSAAGVSFLGLVMAFVMFGAVIQFWKVFLAVGVVVAVVWIVAVLLTYGAKSQPPTPETSQPDFDRSLTLPPLPPVIPAPPPSDYEDSRSAIPSLVEPLRGD